MDKIKKEKERYEDWKNKRKKQGNERWVKLRDDPDFWEQFLEQLADRGRLKAHLMLWEIPYGAYYRWINQNPERKADVQAALEAAGHSYAEAAADDIDQFDMADPRFARLRLEQQRWFASKYAPETYGDRQRIEVEHSTKQQDHLAALKELSRRKLPNIKVINHHGEDNDYTEDN